MPPCCASAIARCDSVTVSMAALATGIFSPTLRVNQVRVSVCAGTTSLSAGNSNTSSKVSPSGIVSGIMRVYFYYDTSATLKLPLMISATQLRPGMVIKFNKELYSVFKMEHRTSSEDRVERAALDEQQMEYLYDDGEYFYFMNTATYEQTHFTKDLLGDAISFLIPQLQVNVEFYEGKPISVELPATVDLKVIETEPGLKGATVSNVTKAAKLETGLVVQVPAFIVEGEKIRV